MIERKREYKQTKLVERRTLISPAGHSPLGSLQKIQFLFGNVSFEQHFHFKPPQNTHKQTK